MADLNLSSFTTLLHQTATIWPYDWHSEPISFPSL